MKLASFAGTVTFFPTALLVMALATRADAAPRGDQDRETYPTGKPVDRVDREGRPEAGSCDVVADSGQHRRPTSQPAPGGFLAGIRASGSPSRFDGREGPPPPVEGGPGPCVPRRGVAQGGFTFGSRAGVGSRDGTPAGAPHTGRPASRPMFRCPCCGFQGDRVRFDPSQGGYVRSESPRVRGPQDGGPYSLGECETRPMPWGPWCGPQSARSRLGPPHQREGWPDGPLPCGAQPGGPRMPGGFGDRPMPWAAWWGCPWGRGCFGLSQSACVRPEGPPPGGPQAGRPRGFGGVECPPTPWGPWCRLQDGRGRVGPPRGPHLRPGGPPPYEPPTGGPGNPGGFEARPMP